MFFTAENVLTMLKSKAIKTISQSNMNKIYSKTKFYKRFCKNIFLLSEIIRLTYKPSSYKIIVDMYWFLNLFYVLICAQKYFWN